MTQRLPRNTLDSGLSARQSEARFEINEELSGFVVVENKIVLSAQCPKF